MGIPKRDFKGQADELCQAANMVQRVGEENESQVADLGKAILELYKEIEAARVEEVTPHREKVLKINERYKELKDELKDAKDSALNRLKGLVADWKLRERRAAEAEKKRIEEEERKRKAAEKEAAETGDIPPEVPPVREVAPPKPSNVSRGSFGKSVGRKVWKAELVDKKTLCQAVIDGKVPDDVLEFKTQKAVSLARGGFKFDPEETGIRAWQDDQQSFS